METDWQGIVVPKKYPPPPINPKHTKKLLKTPILQIVERLISIPTQNNQYPSEKYTMLFKPSESEKETNVKGCKQTW